MEERCNGALNSWRENLTAALKVWKRKLQEANKPKICSVNLGNEWEYTPASFGLFCMLFRTAPLGCWKPNLMKLWERIPFKDGSFTVVGPRFRDLVQNTFKEKTKKLRRFSAKFPNDWDAETNWLQILAAFRYSFCGMEKNYWR
eukprot:Gregarina_sp_Poly_1__449@NODE_1109_length_5064_cov_23_687813_g640_i1_p1_GENE_NODE_1109_length_5064_cov_23_687813_g640_i1NODE_1109_length_5064_cov_23_687813_g640_i1_p1_ORF_typecomplete_len144_score13_32eIF3m_C_helix/PF18005_1/1_1eIF3m_C_helix/PF18005_1/2_3e02eIF3m_C_helix/PF18005_1/3_1e03_NODE_1109_length_5064_cov_23_687813_g640_i111141545